MFGKNEDYHSFIGTAAFQVPLVDTWLNTWCYLAMGFLQELFNGNLREILSEGWLLDWVDRAREEIHPAGFIQAFFPQKLFNLF